MADLTISDTSVSFSIFFISEAYDLLFTDITISGVEADMLALAYMENLGIGDATKFSNIDISDVTFSGTVTNGYDTFDYYSLFADLELNALIYSAAG